MELLKSLLEESGEFVSSKGGLVALVVVTISAAFGLETSIRDTIPWYLSVGIYTVGIGGVSLWWYRNYTRLPQCQESKTGIAVFVIADNLSIRQRIKDDFVEHIKTLTSMKGLADLFDVKLAENYQAKRVYPIFDSVVVEIRTSVKLGTQLNITPKLKSKLAGILKRIRDSIESCGNAVEKKSSVSLF